MHMIKVICQKAHLTADNIKLYLCFYYAYSSAKLIIIVSTLKKDSTNSCRDES